MSQILCAFSTVYLVVLFARILLSWFPVERGSGLASVQQLLHDLTEPLLAPLRGLFPPVGGGGMAFDLSPMVLIFGLYIIRGIVC